MHVNMLTLLTYQPVGHLFRGIQELYMLGRQERLAIALLLSVAGIVIVSHIILDQIGKQPFAENYSEKSDDGELVILSGTIERVTLTKGGGHCILIVDNLSVFIPNKFIGDRTFSQGMNITVVGIVQTYEGKKEIAVQSFSDIFISGHE